ncbi:SDR family NAD(P)-dependent oxidoreductase [Algoriphagus sediminis]|uniref:SDR family NAD(P)-dependent oxidoreductase n=1 Tax=Algoriphagus sediminis TaxID=3057113 RepID=A0ABT7YEW5_9BACT|nr:SDR family NAD(P)-dependent oxidoreductase [Algoriphagus sediminis]MDN3205071.1 SDR family NAD(P)-dependent oxidoreductase [Algoriphagus sediminis]
MSRNIIITGAGGNLGSAVVDKFKREGYTIIALVEPNTNKSVEEAEYNYEVDVTSAESVNEFVKEYQLQHGGLDALALLVGGFAMGGIEDVEQEDFEKMISLNFYSAFHLAKGFLPLFKKQGKGTFLFVGARPALIPSDGAGVVPYAFSKKLVIALAETIGEEIRNTDIRSHIFVPSIIDTPPNRESMPDADFEKWVSPSEIADSMHYAVNNRALRNMTFKLYGQS